MTVKVFNFLLVRFNHIDLLRLTKEHHCRDLPVKRVLKGSLSLAEKKNDYWLWWNFLRDNGRAMHFET